MKSEYLNCDEVKYSISPNGKLEGICNKHYCGCQDKFIWDSDLDKRYQESKNKGKAHSGIFLNK